MVLLVKGVTFWGSVLFYLCRITCKSCSACRNILQAKRKRTGAAVDCPEIKTAQKHFPLSVPVAVVAFLLKEISKRNGQNVRLEPPPSAEKFRSLARSPHTFEPVSLWRQTYASGARVVPPRRLFSCALRCRHVLAAGTHVPALRRFVLPPPLSD